MKTRQWVLACIFLAGVAGCRDGSVLGPASTRWKTPTAGWLTVQLTTPNSDDRAIMFTVSGGQIDSVRFVHEGFSASISDGVWRFLATGELSDGAIAQLLVPDVEVAAIYRPEIQQVAALGTYEQRDLAGYRLQVIRQ